MAQEGPGQARGSPSRGGRRLAPDVAPPPLISPMLLTRGSLPSRGDWVFEPKWDGFRAVVSISEAGVRVRSRNGNDLAAIAPELKDPPELSSPVVLDGELV